MPLNTFTPPVGPSPGTNFPTEIKILETEFGDGYTQATPDGINHIREVVEFRWDVLSGAERNQIIGFLKEHKGTEPFYYQPAGYDAPLKWTCKEWSSSLNEGVWQIAATFRESFTTRV